MISALGAFPRRLEAVSSSTCAMAASSLYAGSTALTAVDSATWDASASSCALAISYGPLIRFCGGVHGANRSMTTIPVSSTLAATAPTPIRGQRWRHHRAASAPSTSATPRYQYASSFVLSQSQLWNTTTLHAANTSMPARKSSSRGAGTSPRARVAIAPTRPGIHRQAATITATTESGTATPTLTIQNPHHSGPTSWRNAWPPARNPQHQRERDECLDVHEWQQPKQTAGDGERGPRLSGFAPCSDNEDQGDERRGEAVRHGPLRKPPSEQRRVPLHVGKRRWTTIRRQSVAGAC